MKQRITIEVDCETPLTSEGIKRAGWSAAAGLPFGYGWDPLKNTLSVLGNAALISVESIPSDNGAKMPGETWRKVQEADIVRGTVIRVWNDAPYGSATIMRIKDGYATLARPFAYAAKEYDSRQPLLGCEVYEISVRDLVSTDRYQVRQGRDRIDSMVT